MRLTRQVLNQCTLFLVAAPAAAILSHKSYLVDSHGALLVDHETAGDNITRAELTQQQAALKLEVVDRFSKMQSTAIAANHTKQASHATEGLSFREMVSTLEVSDESPFWSPMADYFAEDFLQEVEGELQNREVSRRASSVMQLNSSTIVTAADEVRTSSLLQNLLDMDRLAGLAEEDSLESNSLIRALESRGVKIDRRQTTPRTEADSERQGSFLDRKYHEVEEHIMDGVETIQGLLRDGAAKLGVDLDRAAPQVGGDAHEAIQLVEDMLTTHLRWQVQINMFGGFIGFPQLAWKCHPLGQCITNIETIGRAFIKPLFDMAFWIAAQAMQLLLKVGNGVKWLLKSGVSKLAKFGHILKDKVGDVGELISADDALDTVKRFGHNLKEKIADKLENMSEKFENITENITHIFSSDEPFGGDTIASMDAEGKDEEEESSDADRTICDPCGKIKTLFDITPATVPLVIATGGAWLYNLVKVRIVTTPTAAGGIKQMVGSCKDCRRLHCPNFRKWFWKQQREIAADFIKGEIPIKQIEEDIQDTPAEVQPSKLKTASCRVKITDVHDAKGRPTGHQILSDQVTGEKTFMPDGKWVMVKKTESLANPLFKNEANKKAPRITAEQVFEGKPSKIIWRQLEAKKDFSLTGLAAWMRCQERGETGFAGFGESAWDVAQVQSMHENGFFKFPDGVEQGDWDFTFQDLNKWTSWYYKNKANLQLSGFLDDKFFPVAKDCT